MINLYDRVALQTDLSNTPLQQGDVGVVVMIHDNQSGYEVEFFAMDGSTITVKTVAANQVRAVNKNEINHVRTFAKAS